jgi:hypothetical protein
MYYRIGLIVFLMTLPAASAWAEGNGYSGLIAPSTATKSSTAAKPSTAPAQAGGGYSGLIAPPPDGTGRQQEPEGYAGVIQGRVAQPPQSHTRTSTKARATPTLGSTPTRSLAKFKEPKSANDLHGMSLFYGLDKNMDGIPDALKQPAVIPADLAKAMNKPTQRIENMLPTEFAMKKSIDAVMAMVGNKSLSKEARLEQAKNGYNNLSQLMTGLRSKRAIPDTIYKKMGLSDAYISEEKEGIDAALIRLDKATKDLEQYSN